MHSAGKIRVACGLSAHHSICCEMKPLRFASSLMRDNSMHYSSSQGLVMQLSGDMQSVCERLARVPERRARYMLLFYESTPKLLL